MNKKANAALFLFGATVFNIVVTVSSFLLLIFAYGRLLAPILPAGSAAWGLPVVFVAAIAFSFGAYRFALRVLMKRVNVEALFGPLNIRRKGSD